MAKRKPPGDQPPPIEDRAASIERELLALRRSRDTAYAERDMVLAVVARMALQLGYPVGVGMDFPGDETDGTPDFGTVIFVELPTGQISFHVRDAERTWFAFLPRYDHDWDGHSTPVKYERMLDYITVSGPGINQ